MLIMSLDPFLPDLGHVRVVPFPPFRNGGSKVYRVAGMGEGHCSQAILLSE